MQTHSQTQGGPQGILYKKGLGGGISYFYVVVVVVVIVLFHVSVLAHWSMGKL